MNLFLTLKDGAVKGGPYATLTDAQTAGAVTLNVGIFFNTVVSFLIVAVCVFALVKAVNNLRREAPAASTTKPCPYCCMPIDLKAARCPHCTSQIT